MYLISHVLSGLSCNRVTTLTHCFAIQQRCCHTTMSTLAV